MNHSNLATTTLSFTVALIPKHPIPITNRNFAQPRLLFPLRLNETPACLAGKRVFRVRAKVDGGEKTGNWVNRLPISRLGAENVFRLISSATGSPIGQFISSPVTFLHSVDPRIKLVLGRVSYIFWAGDQSRLYDPLLVTGVTQTEDLLN